MSGERYAIGTELKTSHGTRWVKIGDDFWRARGEFGVLDSWTRYYDRDVYGAVVATGVTR